MEEELQNFLEPAFRSIIFGEKYDMPTVQEIIDTALVTALSTSAIEGPGITSETIKEYGYNNALKTATNSVQPEQSSPNAPETIDVGKIGWDGRVAVEPATGPKVTVGGKTYELIGYDKDGAKVYQDVEVLKEQAEAESKQTDEIQTGEIEPQQDTEAKVNQEGVANEEHNAIITTWDNSLTPRGQVLEQISQEDLYGFAAAELGISTEMATEYIDVIMDYTDTSTNVYSEVRRYQREEPLQFLTQEEAKALSDKIEAYIQKAPRWNGGTTFRGSTVSDIELASYVPGYELHMGGVASWSDQESVARDFAVKNVTADRPNSVIYHCDTQGKGTGIQHISVVEMEAEVLCSKESRYVVDKVEIDENHVYHVYLKEE
ncbi:MAG: hypothetical protein IJB91_06965 [Oscillospiraceae bacterium]|nr:hypothetical protein [Oscillospiraceae bacterium]